MIKFVVLALSAALVGACGYDFDTEADQFACVSDDDCVDGFSCAGHSSIDPESGDYVPAVYCVESEDVEIAVWQETMPAFQSGCANAWEFEWDAWMVVSENETPPLSSLPPDEADKTRFTDAGGTCVGDVDAYGQIRVMCRQPQGDVVANSAAMWVVIYEVGGSAFLPQNVLAVAVTSAVVDSDTRLAPALDDIKRHHQFDEYHVNRCAQALRRVCPEKLPPTGNIVCTGCDDLHPCPTNFSCNAANCEPNPEM